MSQSKTVSMRRAIVRVLAVCIVSQTLVALSGCNTTEGVGKDVESAGKGIKDTARDAK